MTNLAGIISDTQSPHGRSTGGENPADLLWCAHRPSDSAEAISAAVASPSAAAAIAAALGHIETALENLERGTEEMERLARARLTSATVLLGDRWSDMVVARTARDFEELARALANARRACEKAAPARGTHADPRTRGAMQR